MLRKWLRSIVYGDDESQSGTGREVLFGAELGLAAYKISNGYILKFYRPTHGISGDTTIMYCQNEKEIAEQIITQAARARMSTVTPKIPASYGVQNHV